MKQVCLTLAFIAILNNVGRAAASDPKILPSVFARANSSYESGDFASAEKLYRQILDAGVENGAVFYNLGNTCFKQKKIGAAIYYWEKARMMLPHDADIRSNLELANLYVVDQIEKRPEPLPIRWLRISAGFFTVDQESWLLLGLFLAANLLMSVFILARRPSVALKALLSAVPIHNPLLRDKKLRIRLEGDVADPSNPPTGCYFHPRCRYAKDNCASEEPSPRLIDEEHWVACHYSEELDLRGVVQ